MHYAQLEKFGLWDGHGKVARRAKDLSETELRAVNNLLDTMGPIRERMVALTAEVRADRESQDSSKRRPGEKYQDWQRRTITEITEARRQSGFLGGDSVSVAVTNEPMVYGCNENYRGKNSWWADFITYNRGELAPGFVDARSNLLKWGQQVEREVASETRAGERFEAQIRDLYRRQDTDGAATTRAVAEVRERGRAGAIASEAELRISGVGTGSGPTVTATSGASSFITPVFVGPYVPYRQYGRAFADQCEKPPMPDYGRQEVCV